MNYPDWYLIAKKNELFYQSKEFQELLDDGIKQYNKAIKNNNIKNIEIWSDFIIKWTDKRRVNRFMIMQVEG